MLQTTSLALYFINCFEQVFVYVSWLARWTGRSETLFIVFSSSDVEIMLFARVGCHSTRLHHHKSNPNTRKSFKTMPALLMIVCFMCFAFSSVKTYKAKKLAIVFKQEIILRGVMIFTFQSMGCLITHSYLIKKNQLYFKFQDRIKNLSVKCELWLHDLKKAP